MFWQGLKHLVQLAQLALSQLEASDVTAHDHKQQGQGLVEYALILALVAIVVVVILIALGPTVGNLFSNIVAGMRDVDIWVPGD